VTLQGLTEVERQHYARQLNLPQFGEVGQRRLKDSTVFVAGLGGLGSVSATYLAAAGIGCLKIVDRDTVYRTNLNRQILHSTNDLGRPKTDSALDKLRMLNPNCCIDALHEDIQSDNIVDLLGDSQVIIDGTDTIQTRKVLNRASVQRGIPFIYGGINGFNGTVSTFIPGQTPCFECLFTGHAVPSAPLNVVGPIVAMVGAIQSLEAIKIVLQMDHLLTNQLLYINGIDLVFKKIRTERDPQCMVCGPLEGK
jgi:molybdopterin/thiamine biosynthesis adenylyltransferase